MIRNKDLGLFLLKKLNSVYCDSFSHCERSSRKGGLVVGDIEI
jgi:hypothetical protein